MYIGQQSDIPQVNFDDLNRLSFIRKRLDNDDIKTTWGERLFKGVSNLKKAKKEYLKELKRLVQSRLKHPEMYKEEDDFPALVYGKILPKYQNKFFGTASSDFSDFHQEIIGKLSGKN